MDHPPQLAKTQPLALSALLSQQAVSQEVTFFPVQQQQQQGQGVQQGMAQQQTATTTMGGAGTAGGYFARAMLNLRLLPAGTTATGQQAMLGQQAGYGTQQPYGVAGAQDPSKVSGGAYGGQAGMQQPVGYGTTTGVGQQVRRERRQSGMGASLACLGVEPFHVVPGRCHLGTSLFFYLWLTVRHLLDSLLPPLDGWWSEWHRRLVFSSRRRLHGSGLHCAAGHRGRRHRAAARHPAHLTGGGGSMDGSKGANEGRARGTQLVGNIG
jgi:hypothetical protein